MAPPKPEVSRTIESAMDGTFQMTDLGSHVDQASESLEEAAVPRECERPFYRQPLFSNRRAWPYQKGVVAAGWLIAVAFGYLLGSQREKKAPLASLEITAPPPAEVSPQPVKMPPAQFVALEGGVYLMGDTLDGLKDAQAHRVRVSPFTIARHEVTLELWDSVMHWARAHGYDDLQAAGGKAHDHPVYGISWGEAVKWCNALSEKEGLTPCYYADTTRQNVMRKGLADINNQQVNWQASGYRLPTEAEWEFAARGGLEGTRFPSGNEVTHEQANYHGSTAIEYDKSQRVGTAAALMSSLPYTAAAGSFQPNKFGLYDMAGNVAEWCWDFYEPGYGTPLQLQDNPHGPAKGKNCVVRGGSWRHTAADARCASRLGIPGDLPAPYVGFRVVRGL